MKILRFVDEAGNARWGEPVDDENARPIEGELFSEYRVLPDACRVVKRLSPVDPPNIIAIGRNYAEHAKEMKAADLPKEPLIFLKATSSMIGPDDTIQLPRSAPDEVDYEAELAVVIGKTAKDVSETEAMDYVFGFTCANDVSARDCQKRRDKQWARGKSFDTFCPVGPVMVTADEVDCTKLAVRSRLNGEVMQDGTTRDLIFPIRTLVHYLSHQFTLLPGTLILSGTPAGVGMARNPQVFLRAGDEISVEVEGIGTLTNRVEGC